jgi:DNA polymerase eta
LFDIDLHLLFKYRSIEKASIDEAFFDFSKPVREILLQRYPYLATVPPNTPEGVDTPLPPPPPIRWDDLGWVIPIKPPPSSEQVDEENKGQEKDMGPEKVKVQADVSLSWKDEELIPTWHDVALSIAAELMTSARAQVLQKLGYSTSAVSFAFHAFLCFSFELYYRASRETNS